MKTNQIWKIYGTDYKEMTKALLDAADLKGCIYEKARRKFGSSAEEETMHGIAVGIKPNLVTASPAEFGATTHPEIVAGIVEYLQENRFSNLLIAEGSWVGDRTEEAFRYCGYNELSVKYHVPLVDTQKESSHSVNCSGLKLQITDAADRIDFLINVPVMKGHCQTKVTCALKNMKGLLPNAEKSRFHRMGLMKPIAHLNTGIHQDFIVVDHICGDLDFEEGGNPVIRNCIMAAADPVLTDSYVCRLMQYSTDEVPYIGMAEDLGVGSSDLEKAEILLLEKGEGPGDAYKIRSLGIYEDEDKEEVRKKVLDVSYAVDEVDSCSACYGNLIGALVRLEEEGLLKKLDTQIGIGQGFRGKGGVFGIGECTSHFTHCIRGCPPDEDSIYDGLRAFIMEENR